MRKWELLRSLDAFTTQYLEAALWTETDQTNEQGGSPLDDNYDVEDFTLKSLRFAVSDCSDFRTLAREELDKSGLDEAEQGRCFWLNRNGHGTGFWDREGEQSILDKLSDHSKSYGSCNASVYRKKIHLD